MTAKADHGFRSFRSRVLTVRLENQVRVVTESEIDVTSHTVDAVWVTPGALRYGQRQDA
ncbi:hypothetical protein Lfu02_18200 [Longispora fulva]|uniref:Uncharacterized protein n=1 Tax=Longispora fulva TaxID=619741 RepID=A0A8J7KJA3_9ACTN|nr:hypothetical protein [Longispora fulva]MBG6140175.1 hypothetical protein [Longispora fulva]GIG57448.1 hypothetical protein Lfu02_18200 [Longispora fulva]